MPELKPHPQHVTKSPPPQRPHWAVSILEHPSVPIPELRAGEDYPDSAVESEALGLFDESQPGWVPQWFPRVLFRNRWTAQEQMEKLTPQQRLDWFDKALKHYARGEWPPTGSVSSRKRKIAQSLLRMYCAAKQWDIPTPDKL